MPLDFTKRSKVDAARAGDAQSAIAALKGAGPIADPTADLEDAADLRAEDDPADPTVCCPKCGHEFKESESAEPTPEGHPAPADASEFGESEGGGYRFGGRA